MTVRYLYGDSEEFPHPYNFLTTFEAFVSAAGRTGNLHHEIEVLDAGLSRRTNDRAQLMEALQRFCQNVGKHIENELDASGERELLSPFAKEASESLEAIPEKLATEQQEESQQDQQETQKTIDDKRREIISCIDSFLTRETFEFLSSSFSMCLADDRVTLHATFGLPGGIVASFVLDPEQTNAWRTVPRVRDIGPDISLHMGVKRKLLSKEVEPEIRTLGDFFLTAVELSDTTCDVHLRKKLDASADTLVIEMQNDGSAFRARFRRFDDRDGSQASEVDSDDLPRLADLWKALKVHSDEALEHRVRLRWLRLDEDDVFEDWLLVPFLERMLSHFVPIVTEIEKRSPNRKELSLKLEGESGHREEVYVRKEQLAEYLRQLPNELFQKFSALPIFES